MTTLSKLGAGLCCCAVAIGTLALAQDDPAKPTAKTKAEAPKGEKGGAIPDLVKGLKETPGCLGVETARTSSGKQVIFAWFKDKKAVLAWYKSDLHKGLMAGMGEGEGRGLRHVSDDGKPVLAIASITPSAEPKIEGFPIPISQVAIELYQPLPGGVAIGGTFAPSSLDVPHMKRQDVDVKAPAKPAGDGK